LREKYGVEIVAWVDSVGPESIAADEVDAGRITRAHVDAHPVRCPVESARARFTTAIEAALADSDSIGGTVRAVCRGLPAGWGEPVFDKAEALLAHAMLSIPATKGFEIGSGFGGTSLRGSEHNDAFVPKGDSLGTATNRSGGIQGGITNGEPILFRVAFKPPATIGVAQQTATFGGEDSVLEAKGRHDPCVVPR
ncbi:MAG: chorismate synthase, partial [Phycisphaeraceae bacterium]|nr:chorismate synthase [Phycisphaeraceae bacterium]